MVIQIHKRRKVLFQKAIHQDILPGLTWKEEVYNKCFEQIS